MESNGESEYGSKKVDANEKSKKDNVNNGNVNANGETDKELTDLGPDYSRDPNDNSIIYTDPESKIQYVLNSEKTDWVLKDKSDSTENNYEFDGTTYFHTNNDGKRYKWDLDTKQWIIDASKNTSVVNSNDDAKNPEIEEDDESEEDENTTEEDRKRRQYRKRKAAPGWGNQGQYTTDPETGVQLYKESGDSGMTYEWDENKKAWFPRINEDFMAHYQYNYGFTPDGESQPTRPEETNEDVDAKKAKVEKEKVPPKKPQWFDEESEKSTKVYVTGLPTCETYDEEKFADLMAKYGVVEIDIRSNKRKVKLYREAGTGQLKGDGLCTYMKQESVQLATTILDGSIPYPDINPKGTISVQRAKFEMKGEKYDPKMKPKKLGKKEKERLEKKREKMLAWEPEKMRGERSKREKVVVIKNVFDKATFDADASRILECSNRLREYCSKFGTVKKVVVNDKNQDGVCQVFFRSPEDADVAISMLDGRLYITGSDQRVLSAAAWDGKTKYKVNETEEEERERLANWEKFLQDETPSKTSDET